ncbi:sodium transport system permease protein [Duganella sp. CF458]|uniref:ABC transporter permease n=1 Tax=Duganella sp. CF458 TaxID=1884368 RepID=UPI0008E1842E|nr:ABC transporter permease [Duganella sp. CF458]SFG84256.1 sodium transport system permease protein [Duganella sp. CF458]
MKMKFPIVLRKELVETLRDRRALSLLLLFVLMYPILVGFMLHRQIDRATKPEREGVEIAVIGSDQAPTLMNQLRQRNVNITELEPMGEEEISALVRKQTATAVLRLTPEFAENYHAMRPARVELWFDSASDSSRKIDEVEYVLRDYSRNIASARLLAHGVSPVNLNPVLVQRYDAGTSASRSANTISTMLGIFFIPAFMFCMSTAVDSTAGERERRSLEVLMAQPLRPSDLIIGKWLAASLLSIVGITLELAIAHGILKWLPLEEIGLSWRLGWRDLAMVCLASATLSLFAAALEIALAINARSFKEAQTLVSFTMIVPLVPVILVPMMNLTNSWWMYMVPVLSNQTLLRELAKGGSIGMLPFLQTFFSSLLLAMLCVWYTERRMKSEKYMMTV